ncbi:cupin domain-containing protein [Niabella pedocola]|uniref:Cupin domain-containing protein n=1 Tax=Niabella pedocola TaxID=1752077 RepID=A0ABS8PR23_9BACT|nr:cupin domain-containing protein [Niabella pedocola]MCD2423259.1 cupin domain-containing protein [Niabella pedocola]
MEHSKTPSYRSYQGGYFRTLIAPDQTGEALAILELTLPRGGEPPPHIHTHEDEAFYVVEGTIDVTIAGKTTSLKAGEALFAPKNVPHSFRILTERATLLNLITPGRLWNYFIEFSQPLSEVPETVAAPAPPSPDVLSSMIHVITNTYKVTFVQPTNS